jgi:hypothetical protein
MPRPADGRSPGATIPAAPPTRGYVPVVEALHHLRHQVGQPRAIQRTALHHLGPRQRAQQRLERLALLDVGGLKGLVAQLTQTRAVQVGLRAAERAGFSGGRATSGAGQAAGSTGCIMQHRTGGV